MRITLMIRDCEAARTGKTQLRQCRVESLHGRFVPSRWIQFAGDKYVFTWHRRGSDCLRDTL
eukprot:SAG31_NODE_4166_length_3518_cov_2.348055_3_plen_62_part_00